jgi:hypothetical protein
MKTIGLTPYTLKIYNKEEREHVREDIDLFGNRDIADLFAQYLDHRKKEQYHDEKSRSAFQVTKISKEQDKNITVFYGLVAAGDYGYQAKLKNMKTGRRKKREVVDLESVPLYFYIHVPCGKKKVFLLLQRFGQEAIKNDFEADFRQWLHKVRPKFGIKISPVIRKTDIPHILSNGLERVSFTRKATHAEIENVMTTGAESFAVQGEMTITLESKEKKHFATRIAEMIGGSKDTSSGYIEINETQYDEARFEIRGENGERKTYSLSKLDKLKMDIDITDKVEREDGHPALDSIHKVASEFARNLIPSINFNS